VQLLQRGHSERARPEIDDARRTQMLSSSSS
jgi:hypothetical protein